MPNSDFNTTNTSLQSDPQYRAALEGRYNPHGFPTGPDGLVLPGFRKEAARAYADSKLGRQAGTPAGAIDNKGKFYDPNDEPWYADPRIIGPAAVGAATGIGLLAGGAGASAGGAVASASPAATSAPAASGVLSSTMIAPNAGMLPAGGAGVGGGGMGLGSVLKKVGGAVVGKGGGNSGDGMSLGKILGLMGLGAGMDIAGNFLDRKVNKTSFKGAKGSNGVSVDPTEVYSQGIGGLQGMSGFLKDRAMNPVKLRGLNDAAGGDFTDAQNLFKKMGF